MDKIAEFLRAKAAQWQWSIIMVEAPPSSDS
jgi:hypothetical protein